MAGQSASDFRGPRRGLSARTQEGRLLSFIQIKGSSISDAYHLKAKNRFEGEAPWIQEEKTDKAESPFCSSPAGLNSLVYKGNKGDDDYEDDTCDKGSRDAAMEDIENGA